MTFGGKSYPEQVNLLDRLHKEINVVLEQTSRLLATENANNKAATAAQATKLKCILPGAEDRFNDALDNLGEEIDHAKLILRRDLAVARERAGLSKPAPAPTSPLKEKIGSKRPSPDIEESDAPQAKRTKLDEEPAAAKETSSTPPSAPNNAEEEPNAPSKPGAPTSPETNDQVPITEDAAAPLPTDSAPGEPETKPSDNALQIDTQANQPNPTTTDPTDQTQDSSKPPDTAVTNNADLESLFGGPTTSLPAPDTADPDNADDAFDALGGGDFDFGPSTTTDDNDNISALLPGLQDYANTQQGEGGGGDGDVDFDAIFNTDMGLGGGEVNDGMGDFLDFDFGTGDADGDGNGNIGGVGDGGVGEDDIFKFD